MRADCWHVNEGAELSHRARTLSLIGSELTAGCVSPRVLDFILLPGTVAFRDAGQGCWSLKLWHDSQQSRNNGSSLRATELMSCLLSCLPKRLKETKQWKLWKCLQPWQHHRLLSYKASWNLCHPPEHPQQCLFLVDFQSFPVVPGLALFRSLLFGREPESKVVCRKLFWVYSPSLGLRAEHKARKE